LVIQIPSSFNLHGQHIDVVLVEHIGSENGTLGEARLAKNEIALQTNANGFRRSNSQIEQTFLHELVHFILSHMGHNELCAEEQFVDGFSHLLHQALVTMAYPTTPTKKKVGKHGK
jgi:predicted SprT family Zn-dependent metalloprotease